MTGIGKESGTGTGTGAELCAMEAYHNHYLWHSNWC